MPLKEDDIKPGIVASLDSEAIGDDDLIKCVGNDKTFIRRGVFLCVSVDGEVCSWLYVAFCANKKAPRFRVDQYWKTDGGGAWVNKYQFIQDVRKLFSGPKKSFVYAGRYEFEYSSEIIRPSISSDGLVRLLEEIEKHKTTA
jgi:hypothetical protein